MEIKREKEEKKCLENEREEKRGKIMRSSKERKKRRNAPQLPENGRKCWRKWKWLKLLTLLLSVALTDAVKATDSKTVSSFNRRG